MPASPQASPPAGLSPLDGRHNPRKGLKVRSAHRAWVEAFLANQDRLNDFNPSVLLSTSGMRR